MIEELFQILRKPLYWLILCAGLGIKCVFALMDAKYRAASFWTEAIDFWNSFGSATTGLLILLVLIRSFSVDWKTGTSDLIGSAANGRKALYVKRMFAGCIAALLGVFILTVGNIVLSCMIDPASKIPNGWIALFLLRILPVCVGTVGFYLVTAFICDLLQSQSAAVSICASLFAISYLINAAAVTPYEIFWVLRYGFFTELLRGRWLIQKPFFWIIWYTGLLTGLYIWSIRKRKERNAL